MSRWSDQAAAGAMASPPRPARSRRASLLVVAGAVLGILSVALWHVAGLSDDVPGTAGHLAAQPAAHRADAGEPTLHLSLAVQQQNGIEAVALPRAPYQGQVRAYGTVLDPSGLAALVTKFGEARAQVEIAQAKLAASKAAFSRSQILFRNEQNVSRAEMQGAEATFRADQADLAAAETQLRSLDAIAVQEWGTVVGQDFAENGPLLARLLARHAFLVQVSLPPGTAVSEPPQAAAIDPGSRPAGTRMPIRFVSSAPRVDPKLQGMAYLYVVAAKSGVLPGMNVLAYLPDGRAAQGVRVPASAIVWWQGKAWAYLRNGAGAFVRHEIPTNEPDEAGGYVVRDLPGGAEIVTSGAQSLLSQEFRAQIDVED